MTSTLATFFVVVVGAIIGIEIAGFLTGEIAATPTNVLWHIASLAVIIVCFTIAFFTTSHLERVDGGKQ